MKQLASHNYKLEEIPDLRAYNAKTFRIKGTKERITLGGFGYKKKDWYGQLLTEFHVKPIHYIGLDKKWHDLNEIAYYFGNRNGIVLKEGWESKVDYGYLVWYLKRQQLINGKGIRIGIPQYPLKRLELPLLLNVVTTVFPDPNPETTSVDGRVRNNDAVWATSHDAVDGLTVADSEATADTGQSALIGGQYYISRGFFLFDTSSIADGDTIDSAIFSLQPTAKRNGDNDGDDYINVYTTTPASNTALVLGDFDQIGTTAQATAIDIGSITTGALNDWTLNATGLTNISKTSVTKFGVREGHDAINSAYAGAGDTSNSLDDVIFAETAGTSTDPKLAVTHTTPGAGGVKRRHLLLGMGA